MVSNINNALGAYQAALGRINSVQSSSSLAEVSKPKNDFGDVLKNMVDEVVDVQKKAEVTTIQGIKGQADIQDVVLAIANAEQALETVVAVRDTAIKAYNSIMQMNI